MLYNAGMTHMPAWLFPAPVRRSRFLAESPEWNPFNVEVALDRIPPFLFDKRQTQPVLHFDYQTQLENNTPGRNGAGRAGIFRGHYLKGVGRTPAAGNWNDPQDRYNASGHLSVGSALRERLITVMLESRGLGDAIVPCRGILLGRFKPDERRAVALGHSSSQAAMTPADAQLMAISAKPADFARISNFAWALDHFCTGPAELGNLFLDLERYLNPPHQREGIEGSPAAIARAMDRAFRRGFANFLRFNSHGLFWVYTHNNFTLDGRYVDIETPLFLGAPFAGTFQAQTLKPSPYRYLGFECLSFVFYWRIFLRWFLAKLHYLASPHILDTPAFRSFIREVVREVRKVFSPRHLLYADSRLQQAVTANLNAGLDLGRKGRASLTELTRTAFSTMVDCADRPLPDLGWEKISFEPARMSIAPFEIKSPAFVKPVFGADGQAFTAALARVGAECDPRKLFAALAAEEAILKR
jgi:hypothetical protein